MDISVIVPLFNEAESLPELAAWIDRVMKENGFSYEVLMVDDGSTDDSWYRVRELAEENPAIHGISFRRNYGKSAALYEGFAAAQGDVVITMDADLQDSPDEIPELYRMIVKEGYDVVSGWKQHRKDNKLTKNLPSKLYNWTARKVTGIKLHDMNCGLKAYKNEVVKSIEVYGEMHRYIPYLAKNAGYCRIGEKPVHHQKRKYGGIMTVWIIAAKLIHQAQGVRFRAVTDQPLFYLALLAVVLGAMFFLAGFLGEMVSRSSSARNDYNVKERI